MNLSSRTRFWLACAVLALLVTGPFLLTAAVIVADAPPAERAALEQWIVPRLPLGTLITVIGFIFGVKLLQALFRQYVRGLAAMAEHLRLMQGANRQLRVEEKGPPEVRELARAANELADRRDKLLDDVDQRIAQARASVAEERNRLAALMAELTHAVVVCSADGRILLYNNRARLQLSALASEGGVLRGAALVGLGRSIFPLIDRERLAHALDALRARLARGAADPSSAFVIVTPGGQFLRVQVSAVREQTGGEGAPAELAGFVLGLENLTVTHKAALARTQSTRELAEAMQSGLAALRPLAAADGAAAERLGDMQQAVESALKALAQAERADWQLEDVAADDVLAAVARQVAARGDVLAKLEEGEADLWLRADSFVIVGLCAHLVQRLEEAYGIREIRLRAVRDEDQAGMVALDLICSGVVVSSEAIMGWELDPVSLGAAGDGAEAANPREILSRHDGALRLAREKVSHRTWLRISLQETQAPAASATTETAGGRPEYYDFDLFGRAVATAGIDLDVPLANLTYSVFDTETTGLEPSAGDEIIQVGAVRIVNGRLLRQEVIDQLVDPRTRIKPEGIPIHGITQDMVRGQPDITVVLPALHDYCRDTVLVAHNAAFDMRFLQLKEEATGIRFDQPVLDTLLLSAVIHPNQETHRLEAICERLGVTVIGRHNALGDAFVTGEVFLRMLPLLADMGITTLGQAIEASRKTWLARVSY